MLLWIAYPRVVRSGRPDDHSLRHAAAGDFASKPPRFPDSNTVLPKIYESFTPFLRKSGLMIGMIANGSYRKGQTATRNHATY